MKQVEIKAATGSKDKGTLKEFTGKAPQAESWAECQKIAGGEKEAIAIFNRQVKTDELNKLRKPAVDPIASLVKKAPPEAKDQIRAILAKHGIKID